MIFIFNRFISSYLDLKDDLYLYSLVCIIIACKVIINDVENIQIDLSNLVERSCGAHSVQELKEIEIIIVKTLNYNMINRDRDMDNFIDIIENLEYVETHIRCKLFKIYQKYDIIERLILSMERGANPLIEKPCPFS